MSRTRLSPSDRKAEILDAALELSRSVGYRHVTRDGIAARAGVSAALVSRYFGTIPRMRRAIMSAAIARKDLAIIAQGLVAGDSKAQAAHPDLKSAAARRLL